jgi:hypothetical protein
MEGGSKCSNKEWRVMIDFKDVVYEEINKFEDLAKRISEQEETYKKMDNEHSKELGYRTVDIN